MSDWESELDRRFAKSFTKALEDIGYFSTAQIAQLVSQLLTPEGDELHIRLVEMDPKKIEEFGFHTGNLIGYFRHMPKEDMDFALSDFQEVLRVAMTAATTHATRN